MVPQATQQSQFSTQRPNGWRQESKEILTTAPGLYYDVGSGCGIYEWQARKVENCNETKIVLYIGSTSNVHHESSLKDRVKEYCTNGSHKADLINDALTKGYELWFRVKSAPDRQAAEDLENELLDRYDKTCKSLSEFRNRMRNKDLTSLIDDGYKGCPLCDS